MPISFFLRIVPWAPPVLPLHHCTVGTVWDAAFNFGLPLEREAPTAWPGHFCPPGQHQPHENTDLVRMLCLSGLNTGSAMSLSLVL